MRLGRVLLSVTAAAFAVPLLPAGAGADSSSFPPTIDAIVNGDVEEFQWMLPAVNADEAHTVATGSGVTVAVIDTGVDDTHPDLEGQVVPGAYIQPLWHYVLEDAYLRRNPHLAAPDPTQLVVTPLSPKVFPASPPEKRFHSFHEAGHFTSACSGMIYRDEWLFPRSPA